MNYTSVILKSGRERSVVNRHTWIFSGAIKELPMAENGDIVAVKDNHHNLLGYGFFSPKSQIVCRMFEFTAQPMTFGPSYWAAKIAHAHSLRKQHVISPETNAYRLIHAEGDFFPGIIADVYGHVVVVQLLTKGTEKIYQDLLQGFKEAGFENIYLKNKTTAGWREDMELANGFLTANQLPGHVLIKENGLQFKVDFEHGQKTGFFLDQRDSRALVRHYAAGKKVLNAFSYTGGFSVYALAGGATEVHSVDISKDAVAMADENVKLNFGENVPHQAIAEDCFDFMKKSGKEYDIMVLDPPAFAKTANAVPNATRGYKELNLIGFRNIKPGGLIFTFSCSQHIDPLLFRKVVFGAAADARRNVRIIHQLSHPVDHPINIYHPESEYLKGLVLYVE